MFYSSLFGSRPVGSQSIFVRRRGPSFALAIGLASTAGAFADSGAYVPYSGIIHGTDGANEVTLTVKNTLDMGLTCEVGLAHWYSEKMGDIAAQETLSATFWHDPETGVLNLMNATDDRMPVETIWCGLADDYSTSRTRLSLPMQAGDLPSYTVNFACETNADTVGLTCTEIKN